MFSIIFWSSISFIFYTYLGYPLLLTLVTKLRRKPVNKGKTEGALATHLPFVTMVIAAHNEEQVIKAKLENSLTLDYPRDKLEILVISDGSADKTNEIVEGFADAGVKLIKFSKRGGKARALNRAVSEAKGELILFSDSRQFYNKNAVRELIANFHDENVGGVGGELYLIDKIGTGVGENVGLYWKYEKFLRKMEGQFDSTLGATGAIYAIRRELFSPIPDDTILDDFVIPMRIVLNGYRVIFEPQAHAYDDVPATSKEEFTRKARTLAGNYQAFSRMKGLLNPLKNRVFFQLVSHKIFRLGVPYVLLLAFLSNLFLTSPLYRTVLLLQVAFYICAAIGFGLSRLSIKKTQRIKRNTRVRSFLRICSFPVLRIFSTSFVFVMLNWAAVVGLYRFLRGKQQITWKKAGG